MWIAAVFRRFGSFDSGDKKPMARQVAPDAIISKIAKVRKREKAHTKAAYSRCWSSRAGSNAGCHGLYSTGAIRVAAVPHGWSATRGTQVAHIWLPESGFREKLVVLSENSQSLLQIRPDADTVFASFVPRV